MADLSLLTHAGRFCIGGVLSCSAATPGSSLPSRNSSAAPPPVDTWVMRSTSPSARTASAVEPPPITVVAFFSPAMRLATLAVPAANGGHSATPMVPFQATVLAGASAASNDAAVSGPMSIMPHPDGIDPTSTTRWAAVSEKPSATTTSTGSRMSNWPRSSLAVGTHSSSTRDVPTSSPRASMNVAAMPPPTISVSTCGAMRWSTASLSDTFAPPNTAANGRAGDSNAAPSICSSRAISSPATAGRCAVTPTVEACARCAAPKASLTNRSASEASIREKSASFFSSPGWNLKFSSSSTPPGRSSPTARSTSGPTQSGAYSTRGPSSSASAWLPASSSARPPPRPPDGRGGSIGPPCTVGRAGNELLAATPRCASRRISQTSPAETGRCSRP